MFWPYWSTKDTCSTCIGERKETRDSNSETKRKSSKDSARDWRALALTQALRKESFSERVFSTQSLTCMVHVQHWGLGLKRNCLWVSLSLCPLFRANPVFFFVFSHRTATKAPGHRWTLRHTPSPPSPLVLLNLPRELIDAIAASLRALRGRVKVAGAAGLFEAGRCLEARRKQESCPRGPESNVLCMLAYQVQSRGAEGQVVVRVREAI